MLDYVLTQLGSTESENLALKQEIAALKKALLDTRNGPINPPSIWPLPEQSAGEAPAPSTSSSTIPSSSTSSPLFTANTPKDLLTSPRTGNRFRDGGGYRWWVYPRAYEARAYQHLREERGAEECRYQCLDEEWLTGEYELRDERPTTFEWCRAWSYQGPRWVQWMLGSQSIHYKDTWYVCLFTPAFV